MPSAWTGGGSSSSPASVSATSGSSSSSVIGLIGQALTANSEWAEKDDFLDVIYWARQILGVLLGLVFGLLGVTGAIGLIGFAAGNAGALYAYWTLFQGVDEEVGGVDGGQTEKTGTKQYLKEADSFPADSSGTEKSRD
ncbi:GEL complex subunit OPTI-like [Tigriopus californicus]|uniref:GEL complex subunit OPTI-like n=1 Tax=Tigriopus californicus TaxID=6832 RepID=UPI0027DA5CB1|nr:GEL complex subunit OPTI-like [Tigriopus californicus]